MFERFTDRARRVIAGAQDEARALCHSHIGTEHLLLSLVHEGSGVGVRALEMLDISPVAVREQVEEVVGRGQHSPPGHIPFTPRAKKVLESSLREALQMHHHYIGTEHIVLGLIREGEGVAAQVLVRLGADLQRVRAAVAELAPPPEGRQSLAPLPRPVRFATRAEILEALGAIHDRLARIETHLGIAPESAEEAGPAAASSAGPGEADGSGASSGPHPGGEPGVAGPESEDNPAPG